MLYAEQESQGLHPEQAQFRFEAFFRGVKEELEDLLHGVIGSTDGVLQDVKGSADEISKIRQSVGDLQQQLMQHQDDVRGWITSEFKPLANAIYADDGVMGRLDFIVAMLMETRREGFDTPRRACVLPPWKFANAHGLSEYEQEPEQWVKRIKEWQDDDFKDGKGFSIKKKRLFLVCAQTNRLVPCGPNGQGYDIQQARTWFKKSITAAAFALRMMCATLSAMLATPLAAAGAIAESTVSAAMEHVESLMQDHLEGLTRNDHTSDMAMDTEVSHERFIPMHSSFCSSDSAHIVLAGKPNMSRMIPTAMSFVPNSGPGVFCYPPAPFRLEADRGLESKERKGWWWKNFVRKARDSALEKSLELVLCAPSGVENGTQFGVENDIPSHKRCVVNG